jgi:hypothetical protein
MKRPIRSDSLQFLFELELEISSALGFSAGELCELVIDGLFALDKKGSLFPGITTPSSENRLKRVTMGATGYGQSSRYHPVHNRYRRSMHRARRVTKTVDRLEDAACILMMNLMPQRMLIAKLLGLTGALRQPSTATDADQTRAEALLSAAEAVIEAVETSVIPCL